MRTKLSSDPPGSVKEADRRYKEGVRIIYSAHKKQSRHKKATQSLLGRRNRWLIDQPTLMVSLKSCPAGATPSDSVYSGYSYDGLKSMGDTPGSGFS